MARPQKKGLDYFPVDVTMDKTNDDIEMLEAKYVTNGFKTIIKTFMKIYGDEGYFIKWSEKSSLLLAKRVNADINEVNSIINDLVHWGVFDEMMFNKYKILTSSRVQITYMDATKKRKEVMMVEEYLLVKIVNNNINLINVGINPQSKEEKSKEEKSKPVKRFVPPTLEMVKDYCLERKNKVNPNKFIDFYESKGWMIGKTKMKSWQASVRTWEQNDKKSNNAGNGYQKNIIPQDVNPNWMNDYEKNQSNEKLSMQDKNKYCKIHNININDAPIDKIILEYFKKLDE